MASAPQAQLPLLYKTLEPLSSQAHAGYKARIRDKAPFLVGQHTVPVVVEEFPLIQRFMPIVFSAGPEPVPLALMGMNEGFNVFVDADGKPTSDFFYVPAYARRYPFLLARLSPTAQELSLCFDTTTDAIGEFDEGEPLFVDGQPSDFTKGVLSFNEEFERSGQATQAFMKEIGDLGLLMEGEVTIQPEGAAQPFVYRGFQMVNEEKLGELRGDQLRKMHKSGMLPLIYAHLFSLTQMREVFQRQLAIGGLPEPVMG